jgi:F420-dependent oxidoreductase-like protein
VRICLMIEGQNGVTWEQWLELAQACERHGLEGLFRSDHYMALFEEENRGSLDAWATLNALAARTERIRLGTMVSPATFRHPSELARVATTADHVSGGRIELGLGAGWHEQEHRAFGFEFHDMATRIELFEEQLEIVHRQWTEESFDFAGRHYRLEGCLAEPKPVQRPHPPLIVGGRARRRTVEAAARFADEYNTVLATAEECRERRERVEAACVAAGRDPATLVFSLMTTCVVGRDRDELRGRLGRLGAAEGDLDPTWVAGTLDEVEEQIRALEAAGVERIFLQHLLHDDLETVALIGELATRLA